MATRRGFTLIELTASCLILAALMTVCLQLLSATAVGQRASRLRQTALEEATNTMDRLYGSDFRDLSPDGARQMARPNRAASMLTEGKLEVAVDPTPENPAAKRITVAVSWRNRPEEPQQTVRLVAWKYQFSGTEGRQ